MIKERTEPWSGLGVETSEVLTSKEAIKVAGLDWEIEKKPIRVVDGSIIDNTYATVRMDTGGALGIISGKYKVVQNSDAFDFADSLSENGELQYIRAGSLYEGKAIWMIAKTEGIKILGDEINKYMVFKNNHDGKGSIKVAFAPVRHACSNTLNFAFENASRLWSTNHTGNLSLKMSKAKEMLGVYEKYTEQLKIESEKLAMLKIDNNNLNNILEFIIPIKEDASKRVTVNALEARKEIKQIHNEAPDLSNFRNTGWGVMNAVSDYVAHTTPGRTTNTFYDRRFNSVISGHKVFDDAYKYINSL